MKAQLSIWIAAVVAWVAVPAGDAELSFAQRVDAQRAIERVYHAHQIGSTRSFEEAVPDGVLERKVRTYLEQSAALAEHWGTPITDEMLERELDRMVRGTRIPERLAELFAALDHDPILVKECLARATLAGRLSRNSFAFDPAIHARERERAERLRSAWAAGNGAGRVTADESFVVVYVPRESAVDRAEDPLRVAVPPETFRELHARARTLAESGPRVRDLRESFVVERVVALSDAEIRVARHVVRKIGWDEWWGRTRSALDVDALPTVASDRAPLPALRAATSSVGAWEPQSACYPDGVWDSGVLDDLPPPGELHRAVWTGTVMLVWGGLAGVAYNEGAQYDPATDTWTSMTRVGAPMARYAHSAVWTGTEMIVFGGQGTLYYTLPTGGSYDPQLDRWRSMTTVGGPGARAYHTAVWTGTRMVVWGGTLGGVNQLVNTGAAYDPAANRWTPIATAGAPSARQEHTAVWTGTEMVVYGGRNSSYLNLETGGRYDPATDRWVPTSTMGALARRAHTALWTGSRMIVWGGGYRTGGMYDPQSDAWTPMSTTDAPFALTGHTAVWTGEEMVIWGGGTSARDTGARYRPDLDRWTATTTTGAPHGRSNHSAVWTGTEMIVWGGDEIPYGPFDSGGRYDPKEDRWTPTSMGDGPSARSSHTAVWTGSHMVVWGGAGDGTPSILDSGGRYDPATDAWTPTSLAGAPEARSMHTAVWTGDEMLVWGGKDYSTGYDLAGGRYDPTSDTWTVMSVGGAPLGRGESTAVWSGTEMIVWGGYRAAPENTYFNSGGRYDPRTDRWSATSGTGAPTQRRDHTAVWTGERMVVWGGHSDVSTVVGGRYDPSADSWEPVATVGAPSVRWNHTAVWSGDRMIVWGGFNGNGLADGGRYDSRTDVWTPMATVGAPWGRESHTAVWTGTEMVVWGGVGTTGTRDTGGRYDPKTDVWLATSTVGPPAPRYGHKAVWTGGRMLVWGGIGESVSSFRFGNGGQYDLSTQIDDDGDEFTECAGDCDDQRIDVFPGAPELCDRRPNDCSAPGYPALPDDEQDADDDGLAACEGDCAPSDGAAFPGADERCNALDDDCDALVDEDPEGRVDPDGDGVAGACDNCVDLGNPEQIDFDGDGQGDVCDTDDGRIFLTWVDDGLVAWSAEVGYTSWNAYRGDLAELEATGIYTQAPGSNALARRMCATPTPSVDDDDPVPPGQAAFLLVTGNGPTGESDLGADGAGTPRPNSNPCP